MGSVVNLLDYKKSRVTNSLSFSYTTEEELASQILKMFNYDNQNIAIPIVKVSKHCGLKVYHNNFYSSDILAKLLIGGITEARYSSREVILVNSNNLSSLLPWALTTGFLTPRNNAPPYSL